MNLAIFGAHPAFEHPQHVGGPIVEPDTRERFHKMADDAFGRNWLTNDGPLLRRLEEEVARIHKVRNVIAVSNGTVAQTVLQQAMGLNGGGAAVVSGNTFVSTARCCTNAVMRVCFADCEKDSLNMDPASAALCVAQDTRVLIPTHVFGRFADLPKLTALARQYGIAMFADAAHTFGCTHDGVYAGGAGIPEFMSFHATKFFSTIEGGAILTNDDALAFECRAVRNFGHDPVSGIITRVGTNAKLSEIHAAFGLASLPALEARRALLRSIYETYCAELAGVPGIDVYPLGEKDINNHRYFALFVRPDAGLTRRELEQTLLRENVLVRLYFAPGVHRLPVYAGPDGAPAATLPNTNRALDSILCLPTSFTPDLEPIPAARRIAALIREALDRAPAIHKALCG